MIDQHIRRLISAQEPKDYAYFVEQELVKADEVQKMFEASSDPSEKYSKGVRALFEVNIARKLLRNCRAEGSLELIKQARDQQKPHLAVELLRPDYESLFEIGISYEDVEELAKQVIFDTSCEQFCYGACVRNCSHNMKWDNNFNCYEPHRRAFKILKKYSGSTKTANASLDKIMND